MGSRLVSSYAALGVGLAIVLTIGLGAISNVTQPVEFAAQNQLAAKVMVPGPEAERQALQAPETPERKMEAPTESGEKATTEAFQATPSATAPALEGAGENVTAEANVPTSAPFVTPEPELGYGGAEVREKLAVEESREYGIAAEVPPSPLAPLAMILPYIAAAVAGSVVFVVTRKRVGW
jgi:hypothetical protein